MSKIIEAIICILSLGGTGCLSMGSSTGWWMYLVANIMGVAFFAQKKLWYMMVMQIGFLGFSLVALGRLYL